MFVAPTAVVAATGSTDLLSTRTRAQNWRSEEIGIPDRDLTDDALSDLAASAAELGDASFGRTVSAIRSSRSGSFPAIPDISSAPEIVREFLRSDRIDGWLYVRESDGFLHPYLVVAIDMEHGDRTRGPRVKITLEADNPTVKRPSRAPRIICLEDTEIIGKTPEEALTSAGAFHESPALKQEYSVRRSEFQEIIDHGFGSQYIFSGRALRTDDHRSANRRSMRKVVNDVAPTEIAALRGVSASVLFDDGDYGAIPVVTAVRVFDLAAQDYLDVNTGDLQAYRYDPSLQDKLVLPEEQRELLRILTSDIDVFTGDIIDGKSAGNVILAKGRPGVGKTLTAEVYAEVIGRPLYSIHSGSLGITPESVRKNLEVIFDRAKRWNAVLLLDEADVFVLERGLDLTQNAIVAEFLRTLEYFDGLLFLTTNRIDGVDEAILARCAAVIEYHAPTPDDAREIWQIMARGNSVSLDPVLLDRLVRAFAGITARDIKMVLRLALRIASHRNAELSFDDVAHAARFRGIHVTESDTAAPLATAPRTAAPVGALS
ncbi:ATP-binding protein [Brevibacterium casei]|uniref:ATP-binding protein n=1 Tax=Brevibacterium casei TaxID=33889 RepID=UPI0036F65055